jgi:hypothetical protein
MLGLSDASVWLAVIGSIVSAAVCIIYGAVNWNKGNGEKDGGDN